jgi:Tfp pilus assembly protein PilN
MRAVILIPDDLRKARGGSSRSGAGVYVLLGVLAAAVVMLSGWAVSSRQVTDTKAELDRVTAEASAAQQRASELKPYIEFARLSEKRVTTIRELSRNRFNWPYALREVSRVMPSDVWLTSLVGTVAPGVSIEGGSGSSLRGTVAAPAVEITGCTTDQANVARFIARLRDVEGVTRVGLTSSEKSEQSGAGGGGGGDGDCRAGSDKYPQFQLVAFFEGKAVAAATGTGAAPATAAAPAATPPAATTTTPAASADAEAGANDTTVSQEVAR